MQQQTNKALKALKAMQLKAYTLQGAYLAYWRRSAGLSPRVDHARARLEIGVWDPLSVWTKSKKIMITHVCKQLELNLAKIWDKTIQERILHKTKHTKIIKTQKHQNQKNTKTLQKIALIFKYLISDKDN